MKKKMSIIFGIIVPTVIGYTIFFLLFSIFKRLFFEYRSIAIIPFSMITAFFLKDNLREWKIISQQELENI